MCARTWAQPQALALLAAAKEAPHDDAPRLVLSDWLDDHGEPERAEFIRAQLRLAPTRKDSPARWAGSIRSSGRPRATAAGMGP